jgi:hypothetical protein
VSNAQLIKELKKKAAGQAAARPGSEKDSAEITAAIAEGRELAEELQRMAATAQALAEKLQTRTAAQASAD